MNINNNDKDITPNINPIKKSIIVNSNSKIISSKSLTAKKWTLIEKPLPEADLKRNKIINDLGEKSTNMTIEIVNSSGLFTVGEINYLKIRDEVKDLLGLPILEIISKKEEKKLNKVTKLKLENCQTNLKNKIDILKNLLKDDNIQDKLYEDLMINFNYIEMRILVLMKLIDIITKKKTNSIFGKNIKEISLEEQNDTKEELLLASKKILHNLKIYKKTDNFFKKICNIPDVDIVLSQTLIDDFNFKIEQLSSQIDLKLYEIANKRPKLIFDTKYDITIPEMKLKPHDTQMELINIVKNNINNGFLIFYKTLPGLGKTSMILSICSFIKKSNELPKKKVIFCCSDILESVRVQVLRVMFNFGIKFGIGISSDELKYTIKNSWNCKNDDDRELIVCDYLSTYLILKEAKNDYLLFFDEPTVLTDVSSDSLIIKTLAKILYYLPKCTILSSATLPLLNEISDITDRYKKNYPESVISEITSNKILVGCTIKDFDDNIIVPHNYCNNSKELELLLIKIKKYPLLGKFYTLPYLMNLNEFMKNYNLNINLESIESFDQENILENILLLLERVVNNNTIDFNSFKLIQINDINENKYDNNKYDNTLNKIDYSKLLTTHAFKYIGCCLIATHNPLDFIRNNLYEMIEKLKNKINIKNINHAYDKYIKDNKYLQEQIEIIQTKYTSDNVIEEKINGLFSNKPKINFPPALQINTHEHIKNFSKYVKSYDDTLLKNVITPESIDISTYTIEEPVNFLLYMGIGIYSKNLPSDYTDLVLEMLSERQLAFIITDESFCYGANYQISNVIINDDLVDNHSINTILQLIGRTSRIGKSWAGKVYLDTNTKKRLTEFFDAPNNDCSNEGKNISTAFNSIICEIDLENIKEKELLEKKEKERELFLERKKQEEIKKKIELEELAAKKSEEQNNKINEDKNFWTSIRSNRVIDSNNLVINEDKINEYKINEYKINEYKINEYKLKDDKVNKTIYNTEDLTARTNTEYLTARTNTEDLTARTNTEDLTTSWGNLRSARNTLTSTILASKTSAQTIPVQTNLYVAKERSRINNSDVKVNNTNNSDVKVNNKANKEKKTIINNNDKNDKNSFEEIKNYFKRK